MKNNIKEIRIREKETILFTASNIFIFFIGVLLLVLAVVLYYSFYYLAELGINHLVLVCILLSTICLAITGAYILLNIDSEEREVVRTLEVLDEK